MWNVAQLPFLRVSRLVHRDTNPEAVLAFGMTIAQRALAVLAADVPPSPTHRAARSAPAVGFAHRDSEAFGSELARRRGPLHGLRPFAAPAARLAEPQARRPSSNVTNIDARARL